MIASPMNFSIVAPWRLSTRVIESKYWVMTSRRLSGSSASPRLVEPFRSLKKTVTVLRSSCGGRAGASAVPQ